jgi:hypothetical protein
MYIQESPQIWYKLFMLCMGKGYSRNFTVEGKKHVVEPWKISSGAKNLHFAGTAISRGVCLPQIPRQFKHKLFLMSALRRVSSMLARKCSLLNRE